MQATLKLNKPQYEFIKHPKKFSAFVGGYRSGKTFVGCVRLCINALENPGIPQGYFAPTYPQIADIFYDTMPVVAEAFGLFADIVASKKRVYLRDNLGRWPSASRTLSIRCCSISPCGPSNRKAGTFRSMATSISTSPRKPHCRCW
ncbi:terminase large subunit domain-containing protein [Pseudomonas sp. ML2-2023-6]|uniref:terminase large subunit domain-containing protein n=1 Tax=Pseudomonas sp. ML2-2023-6 TaxID=3122376 RepID=UPI0030D367E1